MESDPHPYPGIWRAAREIAYCNGGVNRYRSERQVEREFKAWIAKQPSDPLMLIDVFLSSLTDDVLNTLCDGEESEVDTILRNAPPFTDDLLNRYFNEVC